MKTLIVEDDLTSRLLLQTFLSRYGECHVAVNVPEAVKAFEMANNQQSSYDLICMDIMLPGSNGREAVNRIRTLEHERRILPTSHTKIFMTTGVDDVREMFLSFQALCDAYLKKPIDVSELLNQLRSHQLIP